MNGEDESDKQCTECVVLVCRVRLPVNKLRLNSCPSNVLESLTFGVRGEFGGVGAASKIVLSKHSDRVVGRREET